MTTNQLKTQSPRKLKTFRKIYEMLRIKSKCPAGLLKLQK